MERADAGEGVAGLARGTRRWPISGCSRPCSGLPAASDAPADAGADGHVDDGVGARGRRPRRLGQRGGVDVGVQRDGHAGARSRSHGPSGGRDQPGFGVRQDVARAGAAASSSSGPKAATPRRGDRAGAAAKKRAHPRERRLRGARRGLVEAPHLAGAGAPRAAHTGAPELDRTEGGWSRCGRRGARVTRQRPTLEGHGEGVGAGHGDEGDRGDDGPARAGRAPRPARRALVPARRAGARRRPAEPAARPAGASRSSTCSRARCWAEDVDLRGAVALLRGVRSLVDVRVSVWEPERERWRLLTLGERRELWAARERAGAEAG